MKTLALLRHAKSSWDDPELNDFDRPLALRGVKAARAVGAELRRRGFHFDLVVASPAQRVLETISNAEATYGKPLEPRFDRHLYGSSVVRLLALIQGLDSSFERPLLIGHNPEFQRLAIQLSRPDQPHLSSMVEKFPTAAFVLFELPIGNWTDIQPGLGKVAAFIKPRDLELE